MNLFLVLGVLSGLVIVTGNKIVGGSDAVESSAPYQVSIKVKGKYYCGGAIIHQRFVLTAGHCIEG
jgi:secreted trypsin-like serine protease